MDLINKIIVTHFPEWVTPDPDALSVLLGEDKNAAREWVNSHSDEEIGMAMFGFENGSEVEISPLDMGYPWGQDESDLVEEAGVFSDSEDIIIALSHGDPPYVEEGIETLAAAMLGTTGFTAQVFYLDGTGSMKYFAEELIKEAHGAESSQKTDDSVLTVEQLAQRAGPVEEWEARCAEIADIAAKMTDGEAVYGYWRGPTTGLWGEKPEGSITRHAWVILGDGRVLDPTRWSFEGASPYIWVGPGGDSYDEEGQAFKSAIAPIPLYDKSGKQVSLELEGECESVVKRVLQVDSIHPMSLNQLGWLIALPAEKTAPCSKRILEAIDEAGFGAFVSSELRRASERGSVE